MGTGFFFSIYLKKILPFAKHMYRSEVEIS